MSELAIDTLARQRVESYTITLESINVSDQPRWYVTTSMKVEGSQRPLVLHTDVADTAAGGWLLYDAAVGRLLLNSDN